MELEIGIVFETATPFNTFCLMTELVGWLTSKHKRTKASTARDRGVTIIVLEIPLSRAAQPNFDKHLKRHVFLSAS